MFLYLCLALSVLSMGSVTADTMSTRHPDLHDVVERASNILVARLTSGQLVELEGLPHCDYVYKGIVEKKLKGSIGSKEVFLLSDAKFSIGGKYLIFLSNRESSDRFKNQFRILEDGKREPYYGHSIAWWESCADKLEDINDKVYLASGIYVEYFENKLSETGEHWLIHDPSVVAIMAKPPLEFQPDVLTFCLETSDSDDCRLVRHVELVSESSLLDWIENVVNQR